MPSNVIGPVAGNPTSLNDLTDVTVAPNDNDTLCFNSTSGQWENVPKGANTCCLPDPSGLSVLQGVYIDAAGVVQPSDITDPDKVAQFVVVSTDGTEVCIQDFGFAEIPAHGLTIGDCYFEDVAGGNTTTQPTSGINNLLFHPITADKVSISAGTRAFEIGTGGTTSGFMYTTAESLTGDTWTDGKPIYCKVLTGTTANANPGALNVAHNCQIDFPVSSEVIIDGVQGRVRSGNQNETGLNRVGIVGENSNDLFLVWGSQDSRYANRPYTLILKYTKV